MGGVLAKKLSIVAALIAMTVVIAAGFISGVSWDVVLMRGGIVFSIVVVIGAVLFNLAVADRPEK